MGNKRQDQGVSASADHATLASHEAPAGLHHAEGIVDAVTLGLPWPWVLKRHFIRGDRFFFFSVSPCTFVLGCELLRDGFVLFLGPFNIGWASISSFRNRQAKAMETRQGQDPQELGAKHDSVARQGSPKAQPKTPNTKEMDR